MANATLANKIEIALVVSKETDKFKPIRKISDKLVVVSCYYGSKKNGYCNMTVNSFGSTEIEKGLKIVPGARITVDGWLGVDSFEKDGKKVSLPVINARSIVASPELEFTAPAEEAAAAEENPWA